MRFDGKRWWRVYEVTGHGIDATGNLEVTGSSDNDVWVFGLDGLWHVTADPSAQPPLAAIAAPDATDAEPCGELPIASAESAYRLERVALDVDGSTALRVAIGVVRGSGELVWFHDGPRVVQYDGTRARVVFEAPKPRPHLCWATPGPDNEGGITCTPQGPSAIDCQHCVATTAAGEGALIGEEGLVRISGGHPTGQPVVLPWLQAVAAAPSGALWALAAPSDDSFPRTLILGPQGLRLVSGLPRAAYADVAVRAEDDVWIAGGLTPWEDSERLWPQGEGVVFHFDGRAFTGYHGPTALVSVASAGPAEAWAAGLAGGLMHVKAGSAEAFRVSGQGRGLRAAFRSVSAAGPNNLWFAGDRSTLLHWDGTALRQVDTTAAGKDAPLTGVLAPGANPGWVVGPTGIWRIAPAK